MEKYNKYLMVKKDRLPLVNLILRRYNLGKYEEYSRPVMVMCETVNICTNDCIICAYSKMTRKKMTMTMKLFEKVLHDYSEMGGGYLSLTPKSGDIFCDSLLPKRLEIVKKYPAIKALSVTTNAILADRYDDDELKQILSSFKKIQISIYGMDEEEYRVMSRKDHYSRMVTNTERILRLSDRKITTITFGFRFLKPHTDEDIKKWINVNFGVDVPYGYTLTYMDWNGAIDSSKPLPYSGKWRERTDYSDNCIIPLVSCVVFSNGDVTLCSCNDYDSREEFNLGSITRRSLLQLLNSKKARDFWEMKPRYANVCKHCSSHRSFSDFNRYEYAFEDPLGFIGA